jgi:uncharacterized protein (TIRG00374 family)
MAGRYSAGVSENSTYARPRERTAGSTATILGGHVTSGKRIVKTAATVAVTALCTTYVVWKIDLRQTAHVLGNVKPSYFLAAVAIMLVAVLPMAWRWQQLLRARGISEDIGWLTRAYFVSYAVGQILPTSLGGDASRIYEASRRHRSKAGTLAGSVLLERTLGGAATVLLAAVGFVLAIGYYDIGSYLWIELAFGVATLVLALVLFSRSMRAPLALTVPLLRFVKLERPLRAAYEGIHGYRRHAKLLVGMFLLTTFVQIWRVLSIWLVGKSVGVDLSPRAYYVMGPLLFLVMLVPFTINGLAVREAFFISFLTKLHVSSDTAFSAGFLFLFVSAALGAPGLIILVHESVHRGRAGVVKEIPESRP